MEIGEHNNTSKKKLLQWHPAFFASIQIELADEADKLIFENEHALSTKPMLIDVVVIKKHSQDKIHKNIGRIFRQYNIIEYKSPADYLSIDDFYKVYGYTCFYKAASSKQDSIPANELTITFVCKNYPHNLIEHLKTYRQTTVNKIEDGIYYLIGEAFPIQLIVISQLSIEHNLWLNSLTDTLKGYDIISKLSEEYKKNNSNNLYKSVMNIIVHANSKQFREASNMCEALHELWKDDIDREAAKAKQEGVEQGIKSTIKSCKAFGGTREKIADILMENFNLTKENAELYMQKYW